MHISEMDGSNMSDVETARSAAIGSTREARQSFEVRTPDGLVLAAEAQGPCSGPEVLFVHGLNQSRLSWKTQFDDAVLANYRLVSFDLRGHGDSDKPSAIEAYADADRWADDVDAVIRAAGLRRPVLVGWSLGGYVTGAYLRKYSCIKVAGVNFVAAATKIAPELVTEDMGALAAGCISHNLAERTAAVAGFLARCFHRPPADDDFRLMLVYNGMAARAAAEGFMTSSVLDLEPDLAAIDVPILLTHGEQDGIVRLAMSERVVRLNTRNRLSIFEGCGHAPFYEDSPRFNRELAAFVRSVNSPP